LLCPRRRASPASRTGAASASEAIAQPRPSRWARTPTASGPAAALLLYPAFLLVPGFWAKLVLLAALSLVTAPLYPVLQARLYAALPGRSGVAVTLSSAAALAAAAGPLAVGVAAQQLGLTWAMASLALAAPVVLAGCGWRARKNSGPPAEAGGPPSVLGSD